MKTRSAAFAGTVRRIVRCSECGARKEIKWTCNDCTHSFVNPFDQQFCHKGKTATRLCKHFTPNKGLTARAELAERQVGVLARAVMEAASCWRCPANKGECRHRRDEAVCVPVIAEWARKDSLRSLARGVCKSNRRDV